MFRWKSAWLAGAILPAFLSVGVLADEPTQVEVDAAIGEAEAAIAAAGWQGSANHRNSQEKSVRNFDKRQQELAGFVKDIEKARGRNAVGNSSGALDIVRDVLKELEQLETDARWASERPQE